MSLQNMDNQSEQHVSIIETDQKQLLLLKQKKISKVVNKDCYDLVKKQSLVSFKKHTKKKKNETIGKKQQFQIHRVLKNSSMEVNLSSNIEEKDAVMIYQEEEEEEAKRKRECSQVHLFKPLFQSRIYHLAGDILVEPRLPRNQEEKIGNGQILNHFKNVISVESHTNFLTFSMDSVRPLKLFDEVIHCLEYSQDASNYEYAMTLREYQQTVFLVQELIQQVIDQYDSNPSDLQKMLKQREEYMIQCEKKMIEDLSAEGAFACVWFHNLSFSNKACETVRLSFTKRSMTILGADFGTALTHLMRKGFMDFFNHSSRRMLFRKTMEQYQIEKRKTRFKLPSFEVITIDGIILTCDGELEAKIVEFPEHLQFKGAQVKRLNDLEILNVLRFNITPQQINSMLILRDKMPHNQSSEEQGEILSFEYSMISSIFLEKHYPTEYESLCELSNQNSQKKKKCGIRYLNEKQDSSVNLMEKKQKQTSFTVLRA